MYNFYNYNSIFCYGILINFVVLFYCLRLVFLDWSVCFVSNFFVVWFIFVSCMVWLWFIMFFVVFIRWVLWLFVVFGGCNINCLLLWVRSLLYWCCVYCLWFLWNFFFVCVVVWFVYEVIFVVCLGDIVWVEECLVFVVENDDDMIWDVELLVFIGLFFYVECGYCEVDFFMDWYYWNGCVCRWVNGEGL